MKLIIEARLEESDGQAAQVLVIGEIERRDGNLVELGLALA